jgi:prefoldin subunit 5
MKPSPEFRRILTESAEPYKIVERLKKILETRHDDKSKEISEKLNTYQEIIEKLQKEWEYLNEHYTDMSDEEFEERYQKVDREINLILEMILAHRPYTVEFVDISSIKNLREFVEKGPMYFIPRKKEIGRILALALQMHRERVEKGEKSEDEPIRILDIGGGNGSLGYLITSLAKENNLKIEYIVVDPDSSTVKKAAEFYKENPSLIFIEKRGEDFIEELYKDDPEIYPLIIKRRALIEEGERIRERLNILRKRIYDEKEELKLTTDKIREYIKILKEDFGIEMDERYYISRPSGDFVDALLEDRREMIRPLGSAYMEFDDIYLERWRSEINALIEEI